MMDNQSNQINQMLDNLIEVKTASIENIKERMIRDKELLELYEGQLADYRAQKKEMEGQAND